MLSSTSRSPSRSCSLRVVAAGRPPDTCSSFADTICAAAIRTVRRHRYKAALAVEIRMRAIVTNFVVYNLLHALVPLVVRITNPVSDLTGDQYSCVHTQ